MVRLPKGYRFNTDEVIITKLDDMVILYPHKSGWELLSRGIAKFTDDFMAERKEPEIHDKRNKL